MFDFDFFDIPSFSEEEESKEIKRKASYPSFLTKIRKDDKFDEIITFDDSIAGFSSSLYAGFTNIREIRFSPNFPIEKLQFKVFFGCTSLEIVNIPSSVRIIGFNCFSGCKKLRIVRFEPSSRLVKIFNNAFYECSSLEEINLPQSLESIGSEAFSKSGLINIDLHQTSITTIYEKAFKDCQQLVSIILPNNLKVISVSLFENCVRLSSVVFKEDTLQMIENKGFYRCKALQSFRMPGSLLEIGLEAFSETGLTNIHLNDSLLKMGSSCFKTCIFLESVMIPKLLKILPSSAFNGCKSLCQVIFEEESQLTEISHQCFNETSIENIILPSSLTKIETEAFLNSKLTSVIIPDDSKLKKIGYQSFYSDIKEFVIPPNMKTISLNSFKPSTRLSFEKSRFLIQASSGAIFSRTMKRIISIPSFLRHFIIPESIIEINMTIFQNSILQWLHFPASVKKITQTDDIPNPSMTRITFSKNSRLEELGDSAFRNTRISHITIPSSVIRTGHSVFQGCCADKIEFEKGSKLKRLTARFFIDCCFVCISIPSSVEVIEHNAFAYCYYLQTVRFLPDSNLKKILNEAFFGCQSLQSVNLENCKKLETIEEGAFLDTFKVQCFVNMKINDDGYLSYYDHEVSNIRIPNNVRTIGKCLFCKKYMNSLLFEEVSSLKIIDEYAFSLCNFHRFTAIVLPASLEVIERYAFYNCNYLMEVSFMEGSKLRLIKNYAFSSCYQLTLILPPNDVYIEDKAYVELQQHIDTTHAICISATNDNDNCYEENNECDEVALEFESSFLLIPSTVTKIDYISNTEKTMKIEFEEGSNLSEIQSLGDVVENLDLFLPPSVSKIGYNAFYKIRSLHINVNNFKTSEDGVVTSKNPNAILFVPPHLESVAIDPELEIIHSYAFYKSKIKLIRLPKTLKIIGEGAFLDSDIEAIIFSEDTELDVLDTKCFLAPNYLNIKLPNVKGRLGYSIVPSNFIRLEFPPNFKPKETDFIISWSLSCPSFHRIILPFSSCEAIFRSGLTNYVDDIEIIYDE